MEKTLDQKIWDYLQEPAYSSDPEEHIAPIREIIKQEVSAYQKELASLKEENARLKEQLRKIEHDKIENDNYNSRF